MTDDTATKTRAALLTILGNILVCAIVAVAGALALAGAVLVFGPALMRLA